MPLLSGPVRLPVDLPYLDRYCLMQGNESGGVELLCRTCPSPDVALWRFLVALLGPGYEPPGAAVVQDITGLIDAGMRHLAEYHPEP